MVCAFNKMIMSEKCLFKCIKCGWHPLYLQYGARPLVKLVGLLPPFCLKNYVKQNHFCMALPRMHWADTHVDIQYVTHTNLTSSIKLVFYSPLGAGAIAFVMKWRWHQTWDTDKHIRQRQEGKKRTLPQY